MNILKRILSFLLISILILCNTKNTTCAITNPPIKAAVFLDNLNDLFMIDVKSSLESVQNENSNNIKFTFFDSKGNQTTQNENIEKAIKNKFDLFVVNPIAAQIDEFESTLDKIIQAGIPLIIYLPPTTDLINIVKAFPKSVIITGDVEQGGTLEGKILANAWNSNKDIFDKNKDNVLQYVMLQGASNNISTIAKTKYSIQALNELGIQTQPLLSTACNWDKDCAKTTIESALLTFDDKIEAIISTNDDMAIGAIEALQKYGINTNENSKYIPVVGIGGIPQAKKLVDQGIMAATIVEDLPSQAKAIYEIGMNLVSGNTPLSGTDYKFDETGITVNIPYYEYVKNKL